MIVVESYRKYPEGLQGCSLEVVSKHEDLTQAEEVNDSGQKLPKVSPTDGDSVQFTERNFVRHLSV